MTSEQIEQSRNDFDQFLRDNHWNDTRLGDGYAYPMEDAMWVGWRAAMDRIDLIQARAYVIESGQASISALQRHLRIGWNHAARLHEALEREGVVSPPDPETGRRAVLITGEGSR